MAEAKYRFPKRRAFLFYLGDQQATSPSLSLFPDLLLRQQRSEAALTGNSSSPLLPLAPHLPLPLPLLSSSKQLLTAAAQRQQIAGENRQQPAPPAPPNSQQAAANADKLWSAASSNQQRQARTPKQQQQLRRPAALQTPALLSFLRRARGKQQQNDASPVWNSGHAVDSGENLFQAIQKMDLLQIHPGKFSIYSNARILIL
ncbi:hypothetical protein H5410_029579 [Solanum commersonii]|uniref:Uncharacterized protein n=1 Tax=Solanum commersonii TaxID=4109 RepID=A0A9J5YD40_SOLCO|nr:hypothetical protein H5410_029579 [Solanum commersonii]